MYRLGFLDTTPYIFTLTHLCSCVLINLKYSDAFLKSAVMLWPCEVFTKMMESKAIILNRPFLCKKALRAKDFTHFIIYSHDGKENLTLFFRFSVVCEIYFRRLCSFVP